MHRTLTLAMLAAGACGGSPSVQAPQEPARYLAFQVMTGTPDPATPPPVLIAGTAQAQPLVRTPTDTIRRAVDAIVSTVGTTGSASTKLAFALGPLAFDHSDAEIISMIHDAFVIAKEDNIAVALHLDDAMFWSRSTLFSDANKEWLGFDGPVTTGLYLDWGSPSSFPPRMCFSCEAVAAEVSRRAGIIGAAVAAELNDAPAALFAGVIVGWESHMGHDYARETAMADARLGFHSLLHDGFGPNNPPASFGVEVARVMKAHIERWARGIVDAGVPAEKVYAHINFMPRSVFEEARSAGLIPASVTYDDVVNTQPSSLGPEVAFSAHYNPGFTAYASEATMDDIAQALAAHGQPRWAQAEGANVVLGAAAATSGQSMAQFLAARFERGATLVNLFGMGIGSASNPFRVAAEGAEALQAYQDVLAR